MAFDFGVAFSRIIWVMTDNPAYMIILILTIFAYAFSLFGVLKVYEWINTWQKLRAGWLKGRFKLPNSRWIETWLKPTGRKVKIKGEDGMEFELPILIEKDMIGFQSKLKGDFKKTSKFVEEEKEEPEEEEEIVIEKKFKLSPEQFEALKKTVGK